jgi:hypothetical protein
MSSVRHLLRNRSGATAAEFALLLPLLLILLFGLIDAGRFMWTMNRIEKATQMGARLAAATDMVPNGLTSFSFAEDGGLTQGSAIGADDFGGVSCQWDGSAAKCECNTDACGPADANLIADQTKANDAFSRIVGKMDDFLPEITNSDVNIDYDYSGVGYAGDPNGSDVAPLIRVGLRSDGDDPLTFRPTLLFGLSFPYPAFTASLTMEDGVGTYSN